MFRESSQPPPRQRARLRVNSASMRMLFSLLLTSLLLAACAGQPGRAVPERLPPVATPHVKVD